MNDGTEGREEAPVEDLELALGATLVDLRQAFLVPAGPDVAVRHLDAMFEAARSPASRPVPLRRRRKALAAAGVCAGLVVATSGLAAAGVLPEPLQRAIARAADPLGIHLPDGSSLRPSSPDGDGNQ